MNHCYQKATTKAQSTCTTNPTISPQHMILVTYVALTILHSSIQANHLKTNYFIPSSLALASNFIKKSKCKLNHLLHTCTITTIPLSKAILLAVGQEHNNITTCHWLCHCQSFMGYQMSANSYYILYANIRCHIEQNGKDNIYDSIYIRLITS